jgi:hypothetical protein
MEGNDSIMEFRDRMKVMVEVTYWSVFKTGEDTQGHSTTGSQTQDPH